VDLAKVYYPNCRKIVEHNVLRYRLSHIKVDDERFGIGKSSRAGAHCQDCREFYGTMEPPANEVRKKHYQKSPPE
jgi:hypothetical protein